MERPNLTGVRMDVAFYIASLEADAAHKQERLNKQEEEISKLNRRVGDLEQMLMNMQRMRFGRKSEQIKPDGAEQLSFLENDSSAAVAESVEDETVEVTSFSRRKKRTQEEIIASMPVVVHEYMLGEEDTVCPRCGDENMEDIGKELVYSEYERVPEHMERHDYYAHKYACRNCEGGTGKCDSCPDAGTDKCKTCLHRPKTIVIKAVIPKELITPLIKGSKASASIMAQGYGDKFDQGLPWYRQEKEWERLGFPISRQTMTNWELRIDQDYFQAFIAYMLKVAKKESSVVHCDESHVRVLQEKTDKGNPKKCQMWVVRTGEEEKKQIVVFSFRTTRMAKEATDILSGYDKFFVSDGYSGYNELGKAATRCGCWAHVRREFYDSVPDHNMKLDSTGREGVRFCDKLFRIEDEIKGKNPEEILKIRKEKSKKVIDDFYAWVDTVQPSNTNLKDALGYARKQKEYLTRFLDDPRIPISNNRAENAIRPFVIGRKNWLFCNSEDGAIAAANAYSIVETAKANNLDVRKYFEFILKKLPLAEGNLTDKFFETIMPWGAEAQERCQRSHI